MKRRIIIIVAAVIIAVAVLAGIIIHQENVQREAGLNAFFDGEGKPISEIADEFTEKYGE